MSSPVLQCAVVGLGRIGWQFHIPYLLRHPSLRLAAVVDPDPARCAEAREVFGVEQTFSACEELIERGEVDLAIIASPTIFHKDQVIAFLEAGIGVFCDKPMAPNYSDALRMTEAAGRTNGKLMVYQPHRLSSECLTAQKILSEGKLGKLYKIHRSSNNFTCRSDWQAFRANGGGMLLNYGAHYLDQMFFLGGRDRAADVRCTLQRVLSLGDADDVVHALVTGVSGVLYDLDINMAAALPMPSLVLYGTHGTAMSHGNTWTLRYVGELPKRSAQHTLAAANRRYSEDQFEFIEETIEAVPEDLTMQYKLCYDYFSGRSAPFVPWQETLEVMQTLEQCRMDAEIQK